MKSLCLLLFLFLSGVHLPAQPTQLHLRQLQKPVEIITDHWGVPHIYAQTESDLFFAQGYQAAKDRLYQFEIFRRRATGTMAEVLGSRELKRDMGARLFKFRGNMDAELAHYHPKGKLIIESFVQGVNAYIRQVLSGKMPLPLELQLLGIKPGYWTPGVVVSRHNGWLTNVQDELATARLLQKIGEEKLKIISNFQPAMPDLHIDPAIDTARLNDDVLELYNAFRAPLVFNAGDIDTAIISVKDPASLLNGLSENKVLWRETEGSNNWAISSRLAENGFPMFANDPHRAVSVPSLRYIVHLNAPGWNVVGGGEPTLPGVSIGHNDDGAWGLTIFETDAEDLYVYKLNPANSLQYWYKGQWKTFKKITEQIPVKKQAPVPVSLYYSVHGPVTFIDSVHHIAYAVKCGWLNKGAAPYLASLRMDQAKNTKDFREACKYSYIPGENMVWADRQGHILWQTVGIAPVRNHHSGMVPVPGDGRYEWEGYLPVLKRPSATDPADGFICTANENRTPVHYPYLNSIGFSWSDPFRHDRIKEVLSSKKKISMDDMQALQTDYYSMPARQLITLLNKVTSADEDFNKGKNLLQHWDAMLTVYAVPATVYAEWEHCLGNNLLKHLGAENDYLEMNVEKMITLLTVPGTTLGTDFVNTRDALVIKSMKEAISNITAKLGADISNWQYGQLKMKHVWIKHPLSPQVDETLQQKLNAGPAIRGGYENSVNSTGSSLNQNFGASFRVLIDCSDWNQMRAINTPGQSGDPNSKHYKDLFELWSKDQYFPLYFTKEKIKTVVDKKLELLPQKIK